MQDGYSYTTSTATFSTSGDGIWQRNAYVFEGVSFDSCNGHPDVNGAYHNHIDPICLYTKSSSTHSPIIGWMLDGTKKSNTTLSYSYPSLSRICNRQFFRCNKLKSKYLKINAALNTLFVHFWITVLSPHPHLNQNFRF